MMMKKFFQIAVVVFLIAGAYGCSGLGTGTGSGFQGGTEAGNPPTDGGLFGGTEAGNPPVGETTGGPGGGPEDPREGGTFCDLADTPEIEGPFPCPNLGDQKVEQLTPEQIGILHEHQDQQEQSGNAIHINPDALQKLNGALGDFGQAESVQDTDKVILPDPPPTSTILKNIK